MCGPSKSQLVEAHESLELVIMGAAGVYAANGWTVEAVHVSPEAYALLVKALGPRRLGEPVIMLVTGEAKLKADPALSGMDLRFKTVCGWLNDHVCPAGAVVAP
jgi:hypothetical protein